MENNNQVKKIKANRRLDATIVRRKDISLEIATPLKEEKSEKRTKGNQ